MTEAKHTPGPWSYDKDYNIESPSGRVVSVGWSGYGMDVAGEIYEEADARLIAAAPDLLEALKSMVLDFEQRVHILDHKTDIAEVEVVAKARAAISQATTPTT